MRTLQGRMKSDNEKLAEKLQEIQQQNQHLIDNTLQLDSVTLFTLWKITHHTPIKKWYPVLLVLFALFGVFFTIGIYWHKFFQ